MGMGAMEFFSFMPQSNPFTDIEAISSGTVGQKLLKHEHTIPCQRALQYPEKITGL